MRKLTLLTTLAMLLALVMALSVSASPGTGLEAVDASASKNGSDVANYIVLLDAAPVAGLEAARASSQAAVAYADTLAAQQDSFVRSLEADLGRALNVSHTMQYAVNGMVMELSAEEAARLARNPQVSHIEEEKIETLLTDAGPAWIGAPGVWDGSASGTAAEGDGVIIAVLDSGVNMDHPSFAEIDGNGYAITNPMGAGNFFGACDSADPQYDPNTTCNNKLIGIYDMYGSTVEPNGEDDDGHGSHTASTAGGNYVAANVELPAVAAGLSADVSGVAPHANLITYDVCEGNGCTGAALIAAADKVAENITADGIPIQVLNYSISGGQDPYNDAMEQAFLNLSDLGVFVAASAGNGGPGPGTMGHQSPWLNSSGASTHNRSYFQTLVDMTGGSAPADITGAGITDGYGPATIVYAGDFDNGDPDPEQCLNPFPAGTFEGEIVVCDRGSIARVDKGANVLAGGAGGFVLANIDDQGESIVNDPHFLPGIHIGDSDGDVLRAWLAANPVGSLTATIGGFGLDLDPSNGDIMAGFSSRGPNTNIDVLKPNVTAPGVDILAAVADQGAPGPDVEWNYISGTSMSSPHSAGAAALLAELNPEWSPHQIKSAMMMTAMSAGVLKEDGVTTADPFDMGAGSVRVNAAAASGLVMDETTDNFVASNPGTGGDPRTLNVASMMHSGCLGTCSWTRTVESTVDTPIEWTATATGLPGYDIDITPESFVLSAAGETASFTVTATAMAASEDAFEFGSIMLTPTPADPPNSPAGMLPPVASMPVAIQAASSQIPDNVTIQSDDGMGTYSVDDVVTTGADPLSFMVDGLAMGMATDMSLSQDPTNGDPYDNLNDGTVEYITVSVAPGDLRLVAEITASAAPDIDLFVGTGTTPSAATEVCSSTTASWDEYCNIDMPASGEWWILVQNWNGSDAQPDAVTLMSAVVAPGDLGNMTATGPASVAAGESFSIALDYDVTPTDAGDRYYGVVSLLGGMRGGDPSIGSFDVDLQIVEPESLTLGGPAVTFDLGIPGSFAIMDDEGQGLVWSVTGEDSCEEDDNWTGGTGLAACVNSDANAGVDYDTSLVSNEVDFSDSVSCSSVYLDFITNYRDLTTPGGDRMDVDVSTDGGATWTTELTLDSDIGGFQDLPGVAYEVDLSAYIGADNVHVRFRYYNPDEDAPWDWYAQVDDVALRCEQIPTAEVTPEALAEELGVNEMSSDTLTIANTGTGDLTYSIYEDGGADAAALKAPTAILWDQAENGTGGIVSDFYIDVGPDTGGFSADDFVLDDPASIELIFTAGFVGDGSGFLGNAEQITWFIFADDNGVPAGDPVNGGALWSYSAATDAAGVDITDNDITLDIVAAEGSGVTLGAGTYWLSVAPSIDVATFGRWNWHQGTPTAGTAPGHIIDFGIFGLPPGWQSIPGLGLPAYEGLAMRLEGTSNPVIETCDVANDIAWLSVDPTSGMVSGGDSADVSVMYDSTGLTPDTYTGNLCVATNDPQNPLVVVPVELTVTGDPTAVEMAALDAVVNDDGSVTVTWETASEVDNSGFMVLRSASADTIGSALNSELIASNASAGAGAAYSFVDATADAGTYYYWVQAVATDGTTQEFGPAEAVTEAPTSAALSSLSGNSNVLLPALLVGFLTVALLGGVLLNRREA